MNLHLSVCSLIFGLCVGYNVQAQSSDSLGVRQKRQLGIRGYVAGVFERAPANPEQTNSFGWQAALVLKQHIEVGAYGLNYINDKYRERLIFPNTFQMNYKHAGFLLGYRTATAKSYDFSLTTKVGFGEVKWTQVETGSPFLTDKFSLIQFQGGIDYLITDFIALNAFVGYRWMKQLEITGLSNGDFDGFYYGIAMKIGKFR